MPQEPAPQHSKNSIMDIWHKPITAFGAMLAIAVTCFTLGWKANARQQVNKLPPPTERIRLVSEVPVPASGPGRQDVILAVQPPPSPGETVQVWLNQGDHRWYRCPVEPDNNGNWKAACTFGNPASGKPTDKAHHGDTFSYGVFCSKDIVPNGLLDDTGDADIGGKCGPSWQGQVLKTLKIDYPIIQIMAATYQGN